jgi:hypothetical protein
VAQTLGNSLQGTAQIIFGADGGFVPNSVRNGLVAGKTGGENLIYHLIGSPGRDGEPLFFPQGLGTVKEPLIILRDGGSEAGVAEKYPVALHILQLKAVAQAYHMKVQSYLIIIPETVTGYPVHGGGFSGVFDLQGQVFVQRVKGDGAQIVFCGLQAEKKSSGGQAEAVVLGRLVSNGGVVHNIPRFVFYEGIILQKRRNFHLFFRVECHLAVRE